MWEFIAKIAEAKKVIGYVEHFMYCRVIERDFIQIKTNKEAKHKSSI